MKTIDTELSSSYVWFEQCNCGQARHNGRQTALSNQDEPQVFGKFRKELDFKSWVAKTTQRITDNFYM